MVNKNVTGAHYGLKDWLVQRVTAVRYGGVHDYFWCGVFRYLSSRLFCLELYISVSMDADSYFVIFLESFLACMDRG
jgi:hypothetical protein